MELHYMLPRWYLVVKMHRCSIVMENILEEYFGAIYQIFVYLPLTCYEILRLLVFWHFPNYFRSVGNLIQILLSLRSIFLMKIMFWRIWVVSCLSSGHWATLGNIGQHWATKMLFRFYLLRATKLKWGRGVLYNSYNEMIIMRMTITITTLIVTLTLLMKTLDFCNGNDDTDTKNDKGHDDGRGGWVR